MNPTPRQLREALSCDTWNYSRMVVFVRAIRNELGEAWDWMSLRMREAVIAERAFAIVLATDFDTFRVDQADALLTGMRVAAGLVTLDEVMRSRAPGDMRHTGVRRARQL